MKWLSCMWLYLRHFHKWCSLQYMFESPLKSGAHFTPVFISCFPEAWGSVLSLKLLCFDELCAINIDPAVYKEIDMPLLSRAPTWLCEWRPTPWDGHSALGQHWSCPDGWFCNYPHLPAAVSSLLKAAPNCPKSRIQSAVPPVTCCDSFGDKSGLNWVQVSLLWDRREV